MQTIATATFAW